MADSFPHLELQREAPVNEKRPGSYRPPSPPSDTRAHGRGLLQKLGNAKEKAAGNIGGYDNRKLLRFSVGEGFNPDDLRKISSELELVSQEEKTVVVGFASQAALDQFEARLSSMADGGYVTNKQVIYALQGIDGWSAEDRKGWALKRQGLPESEVFLLDVELWALEDNLLGQAEEWKAFEGWLSESGIESVDQIRKPELVLYRLRCSADQVELLLHYRDIRCVDLPPSFGLERSIIFQDIQNFPPVEEPDEEAPGVVVLDSGLASGHPLLKAAVVETKSFLPGKGNDDENGHGTRVAGLALYGDFEKSLRDGSFVPTLRLFSGRVLDKNNENNTGFVEKHIEEAVRYFVSEHECRIFNLSFGDSNKPYVGGHLRGLSVTLDMLSRELGVLFVVSAGNHRINGESPDGMEWRDHYPDYLLGEAWRIIEPAPALNVLTVGGLVRHNQTQNSQRYGQDPTEIPVAHPGQPSPFTRGGGSVDGAIKPELMAHGGNWALNTLTNYSLLHGKTGLGVVTSNHNFVGGHPFGESSGTSMAAPQVAHLAASVLKEHPEASNNFLRALLCANAVVPEASRDLIDNVKEVRTVCGYGQVEEKALYRSLEDAATLITHGRIENKRHHFYEIPLPDDFVELSHGHCLREISVGLAHSPPVRSTRIMYRATRIGFRLVAAKSLEHVTTMFNKDTEKEDYKSISELGSAHVGQALRSKGTVQADYWRFKRVGGRAKIRTNKIFVVVTRNDYPWGESLCDSEEDYALVVSLRDRKNQNVQLYTQIKTKLEARLPVSLRVNV